MTNLLESTLEKAAIEWLEALGYRCLYKSKPSLLIESQGLFGIF